MEINELQPKGTLNGELLPFVKMHGCGNDFILIDNRDVSGKSNDELARMAIKLCDRNFGIGGDGLIICHESEIADFRMQIINSDGSEPEMCGNGIRCFARYLHLEGKTEKRKLEIETLAGIIKPEVLENNLVRVDMGEPRLRPELIPISGFSGEKVVKEELKVENESFLITTVSMGNPHCVIFIEEEKQPDFYYWGPKLESLTSVFPQKANIEFVIAEDSENLRVKVWERGAGPTLACGTGACAVLVAATLNGISERKANVHLPGGVLQIEWLPDNRLIMNGPAELVFTGVLAKENFAI